MTRVSYCPQQLDKPLSRDTSMAQIYNLIARVGRVDSTVLITGESGTGKGVIARQIHDVYRPEAPFIKVDCSAITPSLIESELFGYEQGSFSGAERGGKKGLIEQARGGTLFLDEIGEIPFSLQGKFLRLLQEKTFIRVGGSKEERLDARIIAATHRNLLEMVEEKTFRLDLYYRLNVLEIHLPPLRDRVQDIPMLIRYFCQRFERQFGIVRSFTPEAEQMLCRYSWPGNIRELENVVERLMVTSDRSRIDVEDLPLHISRLHLQKAVEINDIMNLKDGLRLTEERLIQMAWRKYGTTTGVAKALGIDQSTASRKIRKVLNHSDVL